MTVKELIEYLKELPEDYKVTTWDHVLEKEFDLKETDITVHHKFKEVEIT